ncbi:MAG: GntR family transcriptional regulator [Eubacteriales bacterium]|nr:GntR family transcriptional regulator [Eubacteriales bacterium]
MAWELDNDRPIYTQLVERLKLEIVSGFYPPGARLPSVRELAAAASVNPNTMQKAFAELERTGLIITQRTSGRIVTEDTNMISQTRRELAEEQIVLFLTRMQSLGYRKTEIIHMLSEQEGKEKQDE